MHIPDWHVGYYFPTAIAQSDNVLGLDEVRSAVQACHEIRAAHASQESMWMSGCDSPYNTFGTTIIFDDARFKPVLSALADAAHMFLATHNDDTPLMCDDAWFNMYECGQYQEPHAHAYPSLVSSICYLQADDTSGRVVFQSPLSQTLIESNFNSQNPLTDTVRWFQPSTNMALVFKSSLSHYVLPSKSQNVRISVAANFREHG